jgi:hypothetical protein
MDSPTFWNLKIRFMMDANIHPIAGPDTVSPRLSFKGSATEIGTCFLTLFYKFKKSTFSCTNTGQ